MPRDIRASNIIWEIYLLHVLLVIIVANDHPVFRMVEETCISPFQYNILSPLAYRCLGGCSHRSRVQAHFVCNKRREGQYAQ